MTDDGVKRKLAAILSADAKDYSRLMRDDEAMTVRTLNAYREVMTKLICQHHGRVVDSPGDNLLAEFASVVDGVQAAVAIQKELKALNAKLAVSRKMEFRIGINLETSLRKGIGFTVMALILRLGWRRWLILAGSASPEPPMTKSRTSCRWVTNISGKES